MVHIEGITLFPGRHYLVPLPPGEDLGAAVERFCRQEAIVMAAFRASGTLNAVVVGTYDAKQQVYATHRVEGDLGIVGCEGTIRVTCDTAVVDARILVSDVQGALSGGRLFGPAPIRQAEAILIEYCEPAPRRSIDPLSGLPVWGEPSLSIAP